MTIAGAPRVATPVARARPQTTTLIIGAIAAHPRRRPRWITKHSSPRAWGKTRWMAAVMRPRNTHAPIRGMCLRSAHHASHACTP